MFDCVKAKEIDHLFRGKVTVNIKNIHVNKNISMNYLGLLHTFTYSVNKYICSLSGFNINY